MATRRFHGCFAIGIPAWRVPARLAMAAGVIALLGALLPAPVIIAAETTVPSVAAPVQSPDPASVPRETPADLAAALRADGTFRGAAGIAGTVDASTWTLVSDLAAGEPPRFAPAASAVLMSIAGPWSALGSNGSGDGAINGPVRAVAVSGSNLYVGGVFTNVAGIAGANDIARWDGISWSAVGAPYAINGQVHALAVSGTNVYAGGRFTDAGGIATADYVAKWNGSTWSALGSNVAGTDGAIAPSPYAPSPAVMALAVAGTDLYVGGSFIDVAGIPEADDMVKWNGSDWLAMGSGDVNTGGGAVEGAVYALAVSGTDLYAGGGFTNVGTLAGDYIAKWNGSAWSALGSGSPDDGAIWNGNVYALAVAGTDLYVGGEFYDAAGIATADRIARWDGAAWNAMGSGGPDGGALDGLVDALAVSASGNDLYVGGVFWDTTGIATADHIAMWGPRPVVVCKPDGRIRLGTGAFVGNNIYNITGAGQSRTGSAARGHSISFGISVQNDGTSADRFLVKATGTAASAYTVKYFRGTTDITAAVVGGTYQTPSVAPGAAHLITAMVTVKSTATVGSNVTRLVIMTAVGNSAKKDAVKFIGERM